MARSDSNQTRCPQVPLITLRVPHVQQSGRNSQKGFVVGKKNKRKKQLTPNQRHNAINSVLGKPKRMICTRCGNITAITGFTLSVAGFKRVPLKCFGCGNPTLERMNSS